MLGNCITYEDTGPRRGADGGPAFRLCIFPRADTEVFDNWHVGGLRGTGSNDYQVTDLFVPEERTVPLIAFSPPPMQPGPLYAVPMLSTFVSCIATVALGIARAAIEALIEIAETRSGRAFLLDELGACWDDARAGRDIALQRRALVRLAACHATQCAIKAVDLMYASGGGTSLFEGNRLERCFRDVHAAGQHVAVAAQSNLEPVGRVLFGLDPGTARF